VRPSDRKGFGSKLIEEAFASQVGGKANVRYDADGLVCVLESPHV
jgi:two-component sensor histidine kinase